MYRYWKGTATGVTTDYFTSDGGFNAPVTVLFDSFGINSMLMKLSYTIPDCI